jgi:anaerobic selenocysteine-containing dehydrogenase
VRERGELVESDWETAMGRVVARSRELLGEPGGWGRFGFYTSGQLFLEEYYTLTVLWMRMLDRLHGPDRPALLCVDPRTTPVAREADVHLAPRGGTNVALMNGLLRELVHRGWIDERYVERHTLGFEQLAATVEPYAPERVAEICDVRVRDVRPAAELIGTCEALLSTVLQGFYQSNQATAAACQVNNVHLLRGMLGRAGAGVLQMNGQPTAQNTRETGADGDLAGMRNWDNPLHVRELAELWNVDPATIPHWAPPTHAMQIWRYAEQGSIELLWISATNPAISLPDLRRIRAILAKPELFVVVQDLFLTETACFADVVLPAATWGEKTGTFTNADRTVHLSERAVDPPGEVRSDLQILLDYARRMDLRDRDGRPLIKWSDPASAFEAWKDCSRGRPCDYSGLSYALLRERGGIQWPCTEQAPDGTERLYADGSFNTDPDYAETYGNDLKTGAAHSEADARARQANGRAYLHAVEYAPGRRRRARHPRGRARADRVRPRRDRGARPDRRDPPRRRVRAVPLRLLGRRRRGGAAGRRGRTRGERADDHRLGPGL